MLIKPSITTVNLARRTEYAKKDFFDISNEEIGRRFLSHFITAMDTLSLPDLLQKYGEEFDDDLPTVSSKKAFFTYVARKWVVEINPKSELLSTYRQATKDLKEIHDRVAEIEGRLKNLDNLEKLSAEQRYCRNQLIYFSAKNKEARDQITDFLTSKIEAYVIKLCETDISIFKSFKGLANWMKRNPYRYSMHRNFIYSEYDPDSVSATSNKFLDLSAEGYRHMHEMYHTDRSNFYLLAKEYIKGGETFGVKSASERIVSLLSTSYILAPRREIVQRLLSMYESGDYLAFVHIVPLQIEGIFTDICIALGVKQTELDISSVNKKIDKIVGEMSDFYHLLYDYYSFKFPVLRNSVAHGEVHDANPEHTAIMLMLDLLPVCELTLSNDISANKTYKMLVDAAVTKDLDKIIEAFLNMPEELPHFFKWREHRKSILSYLDTRSFWTDMLWRATEASDAEIERLISVAKKIRNKKISGFAHEFIRSAGNFKSDRESEFANDPLKGIAFLAEQLKRVGEKSV